MFNDFVKGFPYWASVDDGTVAFFDLRMLGQANAAVAGSLPGAALHKINTRETLPLNKAKRIAFNEHGDLIAVGCSNGDVLVYDIPNGSDFLPKT